MEVKVLHFGFQIPVDSDLALELCRGFELGVDTFALVGRHLTIEIPHQLIWGNRLRSVGLIHVIIYGYSAFMSTNAPLSALRA